MDDRSPLAMAPLERLVNRLRLTSLDRRAISRSGLSIVYSSCARKCSELSGFLVGNTSFLRKQEPRDPEFRET